MATESTEKARQNLGKAVKKLRIEVTMETAEKREKIKATTKRRT
jgi:hypothetical protein